MPKASKKTVGATKRDSGRAGVETVVKVESDDDMFEGEDDEIIALARQTKEAPVVGNQTASCTSSASRPASTSRASAPRSLTAKEAEARALDLAEGSYGSVEVTESDGGANVGDADDTFMGASKKEEAKRRKSLKKLEEKSSRRVKRLQQNQATLTAGPMTFDERFRSLLRMFNVDRSKTDLSRQEKTSLAVRLVASDIMRDKFGKAIDSRIHEILNSVLEEKKEFIEFLSREVEKRGQHVSKKNGGETRKSVEAPKSGDPPAKKVRVHNPKKKPDVDITDTASKNIAKFVMEWQQSAFGNAPPPLFPPGYDEPVPNDPKFIHEDQLEAALKPNCLMTQSWNAPSAPPSVAGRADVNLNDIMHRQDEILAAVQQVMQVLHLHSLALTCSAEAVANVRLAVARDGDMQTQLANELEAAQKVTLLASDPDLKELPFRTVAAINNFFLDGKRVAKLIKYLCTYVKFSRRYAADLNAALLHNDLQATVLWAGPQRRL